MDHRCERCGSRHSVFYFPYSAECGRTEDGHGVGGRYFELCTDCQLELVRWLGNPAEYSVRRVGGSE